MKKAKFVTLFAALLAMGITACGGSGNPSEAPSEEPVSSEAPSSSKASSSKSSKQCYEFCFFHKISFPFCEMQIPK